MDQYKCQELSIILIDVLEHNSKEDITEGIIKIKSKILEIILEMNFVLCNHPKSLNKEEFHFILNTVLIRTFLINRQLAKEFDEKFGFTSKYQISLFNEKVNIIFQINCI